MEPANAVTTGDEVAEVSTHHEDPKKIIKSEEPEDSDSRSDTPPLESSNEASDNVNDDSKISTPLSLQSGLSTRSTTECDIESTDNIKVVVRVRPLNASEITRSDKHIIQFPGDGALWIDNCGQIKPFTFNAVFEEKTSQAEMFENCGIKHLINMSLEGYSCTAFAFGQTGSGKTHTITGPMNSEVSQFDDKMLPSPEMLGLIERSFQYMFDTIDKKSEQGSFTLRASYLEVYNERVKDLLNPSSTRDSLPVRWSRDRGFYVENLFYVECDSLDDLTAVLEEGLKYRQVGSHGMNDHSSRSHSLLTVYVDIETVDPNDEAGIPIIRHGKISFVDLAGSERVKETKSVGEAFTESQNINKSLLTLGNCISALSDAKKRTGHIPYRDSKLTKLLADSLGGDGVTLMIACISPSSYVASDTLNTLRYANRAKKIKNKPVVQMDPKEKLIISLKREIKLLRTENNYFRQQLGLPSSDSQTTIENDEENNNKPNRKTIKANAKLDKAKSLLMIDDERTKLTTANLTAGANSSLYDMLQEYMMENELLRTENSELHKSREEVSRQQEIVSRENERLLKKLEDLERVFVSSPISFRTFSGVERTRSLPEGSAGSAGFGSTGTVSSPHSAVDYITRTDSHKSIQRNRSSSEPSALAFPPIKDGPYPNYTSHSWGASPSYSKDKASSTPTHSLPDRTAIRAKWSKSSPAKLRKLPLTPDKHQGGYAQIFAKNREKKSKDSKQSVAKQQAKQPVKALNEHKQTRTKQNDNSFLNRNHYQAGYNYSKNTLTSPQYQQNQAGIPNHQPGISNQQPGIPNHQPGISNQPGISYLSNQSAVSHQSAGSNNQQALYYQQHSFQPSPSNGQYGYYNNGRQYSGSKIPQYSQNYQGKPNR